MTRSLLALLFALVTVARPLFGQTAPLTIPPPTGLVNDFANVIPGPQRARIEAVAQQVRERSGGEIAVVTLADVGAREAGDVALEIGRQWKVGSNAAVGARTRNTGVVVLLVPKESSSDGRGKFFVATGQGTEGFLTDAETGVIRRETLPLRQRAAYGDALELTTVRLGQAYAREFGFTLDSAGAFAQARQPQYEYRRTRQARGRGGISLGTLVILGIVAVVIISAISRRGGGGRGGRGGGGGFPVIIPFPIGGGWNSGGWGSGGGWGGGGGGGFGGFGGGGGFSGGGSGDDW